jgi:hypothetical protein
MRPAGPAGHNRRGPPAFTPEAAPPPSGRRKVATRRRSPQGNWHLLNDPAARYRDLGPDWHATHTDRSRKARNARRQLEALGYDVIITLREDAA